MTEYRVLKGAADATTSSAFETIARGAINIDQNGLMNPVFTDQIVDGTVYVPELYTEYNDNTYGCYKQSVSDALVSVKCSKELVASEYVTADGQRYCLAKVNISTTLSNKDKDTRYLVRVWREVDGEKTLLNDFTDDVEVNESVTANYSQLAYQGKGTQDEFNKDENTLLTLNDIFLFTPVASTGMKADGQPQTVNLPDVKYYATLYVMDDASSKFYVKKEEDKIEGQSIPTGINAISAGAQVESVRYYNVAGVESSKPFAGMNIVVTRYTDGSTTTSKVVR